MTVLLDGLRCAVRHGSRHRRYPVPLHPAPQTDHKDGPAGGDAGQEPPGHTTGGDKPDAPRRQQCHGQGQER